MTTARFIGRLWSFPMKQSGVVQHMVMNVLAFVATATRQPFTTICGWSRSFPLTYNPTRLRPLCSASDSSELEAERLKQISKTYVREFEEDWMFTLYKPRIWFRGFFLHVVLDQFLPMLKYLLIPQTIWLLFFQNKQCEILCPLPKHYPALLIYNFEYNVESDKASMMSLSIVKSLSGVVLVYIR